MQKREIIEKIVLILLFILVIKLVVAPPPSERAVRGTVFKADHVTQVPLVTYVFINNTNTGATTSTYTSGPPTQSGRYSATLVAGDNDVIYVRAFNETMWGEYTGNMGSSQVVIDFNMNMSRDPEAKVVILFPENHSYFIESDSVNVTANITLLGNPGTDCNTTISFSVADVFNLYTGEEYTLDLGNMNWFESVLVSWNLTGIGGTTNITIVAECSESNVNFEELNRFTVYNISHEDVGTPVVNIESPGNNTFVNNPAFFFYNVSDAEVINNCSLIINDVETNISLFPDKDKSLNFSYSLTQKNNLWYINCTDNSPSKLTGSSGVYNLTLNDYPYITNHVIEDPVNLIAGTTKTVYCNGTVTDLDSYQDVFNVNASLFFTGLSTESPLNKSNNYYNSSCTLWNGLGNNINFYCGFDVEYYANNGSWYCNVSAEDYINSTNTSEISTEVNDLLAIGISQSIIDFGNLQKLQISPDDVFVNITNFGNIDIDLNIFAYAHFIDDNISMNCTEKNISFNNERFSVLPDQNYAIMTPVDNSENKVLVDVNLPKKVYGATEDSKKSMFWKLQIPLEASGRCDGKVVFGAIPNQ